MSATWTATLQCPHVAGRVAVARPAGRPPSPAEVQLALHVLGLEHVRRAPRGPCPVGRRLMDAAWAVWDEFRCELLDLELRLDDLAAQLGSLDDACDPKARIEAADLRTAWAAAERDLTAARAERRN